MLERHRTLAVGVAAERLAHVVGVLVAGVVAEDAPVACVSQPLVEADRDAVGLCARAVRGGGRGSGAAVSAAARGGRAGGSLAPSGRRDRQSTRGPTRRRARARASAAAPRRAGGTRAEPSPRSPAQHAGGRGAQRQGGGLVRAHVSVPQLALALGLAEDVPHRAAVRRVHVEAILRPLRQICARAHGTMDWRARMWHGRRAAQLAHR